ncbi:MAG: DNA double-strand break repair nuclease NurA [Tenericutes bacterium]|nr:DNA double-strand break repair nuclease NurA [Mycoplasmatota bacterium]
MIDIEVFMKAICNKIPPGLTFEPSDANLDEYFQETAKTEEEEDSSLEYEDSVEQESVPIDPRYPIDSQVLAIDTTNFTLGQIPDGLVGALRASIIKKSPGKTSHSLERYGPYLVPITNQNKAMVYKDTFRALFGRENTSVPPDNHKTLDRFRSWFERYLQRETARNNKNSLILLDGSLIGGFVGDPTFILKGILKDAAANGNTIVAMSKSTGLTLKGSRCNILSLLDGVQGPCYIGDIKKRITQNPERYLGEVYVAKLTPLGQPFRIDILKDSPLSHDEVFSQIAGLAGDYGYPEELKLAHMTCILGSIEIIELQAAAIGLHGLSMKEELRPKIFPL